MMPKHKKESPADDFSSVFETATLTFNEHDHLYHFPSDAQFDVLSKPSSADYASTRHSKSSKLLPSPARNA